MWKNHLYAIRWHKLLFVKAHVLLLLKPSFTFMTHQVAVKMLGWVPVFSSCFKCCNTTIWYYQKSYKELKSVKYLSLKIRKLYCIQKSCYNWFCLRAFRNEENLFFCFSTGKITSREAQLVPPLYWHCFTLTWSQLFFQVNSKKKRCSLLFLIRFCPFQIVWSGRNTS